MELAFPTFVRASHDSAGGGALPPTVAPQKSLVELVIEAKGELGLVPQRRQLSRKEFAAQQRRYQRARWADEMGQPLSDSDGGESGERDSDAGGEDVGEGGAGKDLFSGGAGHWLETDSPSDPEALWALRPPSLTGWSPPAHRFAAWAARRDLPTRYAAAHGVRCVDQPLAPTAGGAMAGPPLAWWLRTPLLTVGDVQLPGVARLAVEREFGKGQQQQQQQPQQRMGGELAVKAQELTALLLMGGDVNANADADDAREAVSSPSTALGGAPGANAILRGIQQFALGPMLEGHHAVLCGPHGAGKRTAVLLATAANVLALEAQTQREEETAEPEVKREKGEEEEDEMQGRREPNAPPRPRAVLLVQAYSDVMKVARWLSDVFGPEAFAPFTFSHPARGVEGPRADSLQPVFLPENVPCMPSDAIDPSWEAPAYTAPPPPVYETMDPTAAPPLQDLVKLLQDGYDPSASVAETKQESLPKESNAGRKRERRERDDDSTDDNADDRYHRHHRHHRSDDYDSSRRSDRHSSRLHHHHHRSHRSRDRKEDRYDDHYDRHHHRHHRHADRRVSDRDRRAERSYHDRRDRSDARSRSYSGSSYATDSDDGDRRTHRRGRHHAAASSSLSSSRHHRHAREGHSHHRKERHRHTEREEVRAREAEAPRDALKDAINASSLPASPAAQPLPPPPPPPPFKAPVSLSFLQRRVPILISTPHALQQAIQVQATIIAAESGGQEQNPMTISAAVAALPLEKTRVFAVVEAERTVALPPLKETLSRMHWMALTNAVDVECQYLFTADRLGAEVVEFVSSTLVPDVNFLDETTAAQLIASAANSADEGAAAARKRQFLFAWEQADQTIGKFLHLQMDAAPTERPVGDDATRHGQRDDVDAPDEEARRKARGRAWQQEAERARLHRAAALIHEHFAVCERANGDVVARLETAAGAERVNEEAEGDGAADAYHQRRQAAVERSRRLFELGVRAAPMVFLLASTRREQQTLVGELPQLLNGSGGDGGVKTFVVTSTLLPFADVAQQQYQRGGGRRGDGRRSFQAEVDTFLPFPSARLVYVLTEGQLHDAKELRALRQRQRFLNDLLSHCPLAARSVRRGGDGRGIGSTHCPVDVLRNTLLLHYSLPWAITRGAPRGEDGGPSSSAAAAPKSQRELIQDCVGERARAILGSTSRLITQQQGFLASGPATDSPATGTPCKAPCIILLAESERISRDAGLWSALMDENGQW